MADDRKCEEPEETDETADPAGECEAAEEVGEQGESAPEEDWSEQGSGFDPGEAMPETDVFDMLRAAIGLFAQEAWIALGVQARYGAAETAVDLKCARIAIDTTRILVENLGDEATDEEKREFEQLLTNLRINFLRRKSKSHEGDSADA